MNNNNGINDQTNDEIESFDSDIDESLIDDGGRFGEEPEEFPEPELDIDEIDDPPGEASAADGKQYELYIDGPYKLGFVERLKNINFKLPGKKTLIGASASIAGVILVVGAALWLMKDGDSHYEAPAAQSVDSEWEEDWDNWDDEESWADWEENNQSGTASVATPEPAAQPDTAASAEVELIQRQFSELNDAIQSQNDQISSLNRGLSTLTRRVRTGDVAEAQELQEQNLSHLESEIRSLRAELETMNQEIARNTEIAEKAQKAAAEAASQPASQRAQVRPVQGSEIQILGVAEGGVAFMKRLSDGHRFPLKVGEGLRGRGIVTDITVLGCIHVGSQRIEPVGGTC